MTEMYKGYGGSLYGSVVGTRRMPKFTDIWDEEIKFLSDYNNIGIQTTITEDSARTLYYLLYASYGNSTIASSDVTRFKYKLFATVFQYAPTWEKRLDIQKKLRELTESELMHGSTQIYNSAENPSTEPSTGNSEQLLDYINNQNVTHNKKGKLTAYSMLDAMLKTDVTGDFISKFRKLFITVTAPEEELIYEEGEEQW